MTTAHGVCRVRLVPDGPLLVRGASFITDDEGIDHEVDRPVVAVCVCGLTQSAPWCDGTHKAPAIAARARQRTKVAEAEAVGQ